MGFFLEKHKELIKLIVAMDHAAASVDVANSYVNLTRLRKQYLVLRTEIRILSNIAYKQMKETRDMKEEEKNLEEQED